MFTLRTFLLCSFSAWVLLLPLLGAVNAAHPHPHPHQKKEIVLSSGVKLELDYVLALSTTTASEGDVLLLHGSKYDADTWVETNTLAFLAENGYNA